uniref:Putative lipocalin n=1 Tax=Rhipicephalus microplus TaxID=6941 RepID=A0A6G5A253_RHIMP
MTSVNTLFNALYFAAHVILLHSQIANLQPQDVPDITKFYSEFSTIWIVNTTMHTKKYCELDFVNKTTPDYANFSRIYFFGPTMEQDYLQGLFTMDDKTRIIT